ncbi:hypothetical protein R5R35_007396 [Gryllus longicercus]|uniref:CHK kinase-like domain-containing protein n=1 Tax=Gryllus longicercus TaxID=2509291 RepID=A0AAN9VL71_9ORTH
MSEEKSAEIEVPSWLNKELIQQAIRNSGQESLRLEKMAVQRGSAPGDNYASIIYRVKATLSDGSERSLLVKGPPAGELMASEMAENGLFAIETNMLANIVPRIEGVLEEVAPGRFGAFAARCPLGGTAPVHHLVMEDLRPEGFTLAERKRGLGLRHCLVALRALARFHAASHALLRRQPELPQIFGNPWEMARGGSSPFVEAGLQSAADACRLWPGFEAYADALEKYKNPEQIKKLVDMFDTKNDGFNVVVHGDFWTNNMMFRYEDGIPVDIRFVDYQVSNVCSPAIDILYFLNTSLSDNVSEHHQDLLIREYHAELQEVMGLLGLKAPSLQELLADLDRHGLYAVYSSTCVTPIVRATQEMDIEARLAGDQLSGAQAYQQPAMRRWFQRVLPEYNRKGWL